MNSFSDTIVSRSPAMAALMDSLPMLVAIPVPLLITGESGVGKGLLAQHIAQLAGDQLPFVEVNCAALSEDRAAEQLFGERRDGGFTEG